MDKQEFIGRLEIDVPFFAHHIIYPVLYPLGREVAPKQSVLINSFRNDPHTVGIFARQCIAEGSVIHTREGKLIPIENHPESWLTNENTDILEIRVRGGRVIRCTQNHPISTNKGWIKAGELKNGDMVVCLQEWDKFGDGIVPYSFNKYVNMYRTDTIEGEYIINNELAELLGWITTDGYFAKGQSVKFTNINPAYLDRVRYLVEKHFIDIKIKTYEKGNGKDLLFTTGSKNRHNSLLDFLKAMEFQHGFPTAVANYFTREEVIHFIKSSYAGDGYIHHKKKRLNRRTLEVEIGLACGNDRIYSEYYRELLSKLGLNGQIKEEKLPKASPGKIFKRIVIGGTRNARKFSDIIGDILDKPLNVPCASRENKIELFSGIDGEVLTHERVVSIKSHGKSRVWDVHYPDKGWFICGGMKVHNSGKSESMALYNTHELCWGRTKEGGAIHIFLYAPSLPQTGIVMGRVHEFFNAVPLLKGYVDEQLKRSIKMKNGNTIHTLSASEQAHVDGYSPTHIEIDESQDVSDRAYYESILPSGSATGAKIHEIGVPKRRNHFYRSTRIKSDVRLITQKWDECPFIDRAFVLKRKTRMTRDMFDAAYNCKFLTDVDVAFSTEMLDSIISIDIDADDPPELPKMIQYFLGGDIGKQDESVFVILGFDGKKLYQVDMRRMSAFETYKSVFDEIVSLYDEYNISNGVIDATREESLVDMLPNNLNVEGIFLSSEEKQTIVEEFLKLGEGDVEVGYDPQVFLWKDYDLRQQFYEWEAKKLKSGKTRYHHPKGSNDDIVIAVLLACKAYIEENNMADYGTGAGTSARTVGGTLSVLNDNNPLSVLRHDNPFKER